MRNDNIVFPSSSAITGAILFAGFLVTFFSVWSELVGWWATGDDNSHGFLIVPVCLVMLWWKRDKLVQVNLSPSIWGLVAVVASLLIYLFAHFAEILTLASLSMIFFLFGVVFYYGGIPLLREMLFPLSFLLLMIPVPAQIYSYLTIPLQLFVTECSVSIGSIFAIPIYNEGNVIFLPGRTIQVVQACSGLRSIMTLVTLGAIIGYFTVKSRRLRGLLFVFGIPAAIVVNIVRIVTLITFLYYFNVNLAAESAHTAFGLGIFLLSIALMLIMTKAVLWWEKETV